MQSVGGIILCVVGGFLLWGYSGGAGKWLLPGIGCILFGIGLVVEHIMALDAADAAAEEEEWRGR
jgi:hypothetical protein